MHRFLRLLAGRDPSQRLQRAAQLEACRHVDDVEACMALAEQIADIPRADLEREIDRWFPRDEFIKDRAYRLLVGVRDGGRVPPIPVEHRETFEREELGLAPVPEAFARLAETTPALLQFQARARAGEHLGAEDLRSVLRPLVAEAGPVARRIVREYLDDCEHARNDNRSLLEREHTLVGYHGTLGA